VQRVVYRKRFETGELDATFGRDYRQHITRFSCDGSGAATGRRRGVSRLVRGDRAYSFYMHAARQADDHAGGLTRNQRFVAIEYSASFGTYPPDDVFAFGSPYIDRPYRTDEERCGDLPPLRIRYDAPVTDFAVGVFDVRTGRNGDIRDVRSLLTFPGQLSDDVLRRLRRVRSHAIHFDDYVVLTFDPCLSGRFIAGDQPDVCLVEPTSDEVD